MSRLKRHPITSLLPRACLALAVLIASPAYALETPATNVYLIDDSTDTVLLEKQAHEPMPPASMLKLMTAYMAFERLKEGSLGLDDTLPVSEKAWRMGGSKMFVKVNTRVAVEDLLRGIIVQSGNDACIVIAEGLAGSEGEFADQMTVRGLELGLENSIFRNATGWPDPEQHMTARDVALLAKRLIHDFPDLYGYFKEKNFTYNDIRQGNRNPLLYKNMGADGLKTGHTQESGFGLAASALRNDRRLILVVNGLSSVNKRAREAERLLDWGFSKFNSYALFSAGDTVEEVDVWLGESAKVPLVIEDGLAVTLPRKSRRDMTATVVYDGPLPAPIAAGQEIAKLVVSAPDTEAVEVPLVAGRDVKRLGLFGRLGAALSYLLWGAAGR
jgi:D-alanyl-D-alanine carboxypeptidase (penicillin-binding protein 5/6)